MGDAMSQDIHRKEVHLTFSADISGEPLVCNLVKQFDLMFNISKAQISPRKEGQLTLELIGAEPNILEGIGYLKECGVKVLGLAHQVRRVEELCMHCGMCTAMCPTDALTVDKTSRLVMFTQENCTACGLCTRICPVQAMVRDIRQCAM